MEKWMKSKKEELIVGKSNEIAVRKARKFVKGKDGYRFLFLYAGTGCGKTALTQAVKQQLVRKVMVVRMRTTDDLVSELIYWLGKGYPLSEFHRNYTKIDGLLLEDIHNLKGMPETKQYIKELIALLQSQNIRVWLTSEDRSMLSDLGLGGFKVVSLHEPNIKMKRDLLRSYTKEKGFKLSNEMINMLAEKNENIRTLQGMLNKGMFYQDVLGKPFSQSLLDDIIRLENARLRRK